MQWTKHHVFRWMVGTVLLTASTLGSVAGFYLLVSSPPLHLVYEKLPAAGPNSVYVPGSGFAGFWYHLGMFDEWLPHHLLPFSNDSNSSTAALDFYCYSSGCLSLLPAVLNRSVDELFDMANGIQVDWLGGRIHQYDIVERFVGRILPDQGSIFHDRLSSFLPRLHVLTTPIPDGETTTSAVQVNKASNVTELAELLVQTTHIPWLTGSAATRHLDGGFSRMLHPECEHTVHVPWADLTMMLNFLNPGMSRQAVYDVYQLGRRHGHNYNRHRPGLQQQQEEELTMTGEVERNFDRSVYSSLVPLLGAESS